MLEDSPCCGVPYRASRFSFSAFCAIACRFNRMDAYRSAFIAPIARDMEVVMTPTNKLKAVIEMIAMKDVKKLRSQPRCQRCCNMFNSQGHPAKHRNTRRRAVLNRICDRSRGGPRYFGGSGSGVPQIGLEAHQTALPV